MTVRTGAITILLFAAAAAFVARRPQGKSAPEVAVPVTPVATKVLSAVLAHPDDETTCSGTLARAAAAGWQVCVIFATSGEAGADLSGRSLTGEALAAEREGEVTRSLQMLGVREVPVFLRLADGGLPRQSAMLRHRIARQLETISPALILTFGPDGYTGHADHIATGKETEAAALQAVPGAAVFRVALGRQRAGWEKVTGQSSGAAPLPANLVEIDVTAFQALRLSSLECHRSQFAPEVLQRLRQFREEYPFEELVPAGTVATEWPGP